MKLETIVNKTEWTTRSLIACVRRGLSDVGFNRPLSLTFHVGRFETVSFAKENGEVIDESAFAAAGLERGKATIVKFGRFADFYVGPKATSRQLVISARVAALYLRGVKGREACGRWEKWLADRDAAADVPPLVPRRRNRKLEFTKENRAELAIERRFARVDAALDRNERRRKRLETSLRRLEGARRKLLAKKGRLLKLVEKRRSEAPRPKGES